MADYQAILDEELEVLESIFPDELEKTSDRQVKIRVEPDDPSPSSPMTLDLVVEYPETYPDVIAHLSFETVDDESGELTEEEAEKALAALKTVAEESIGMAMTFTIASAAREALTAIVADRIQREKDEDDKRTREYEEAEAARTRGTPLTPNAFVKWRKAYMLELQQKREAAELERVRAMPPKEREDYKKKKDRPTGKQLFLTQQNLATSDEALYEEGGVAVDLSKYTREAREAERRREEEEEEQARAGIVGDGNDSD